MGSLFEDVVIIAEVGCNHCGDFALAQNFVDELANLADIAQLSKNLRIVAQDLKYKEPDILESETFYRVKHKKRELC